MTLAAVAAAVYLAYEPAALRSRDEPAAAASTQRPGAADVVRGTPGSLPGGAAQGTTPGSRADNPRAFADDASGARELRPGYTMAELCSAGIVGEAWRCQTGTYDGNFSASGSGVASTGSAAGQAISGRVLTSAGVGLGGITIVAAPERLAGEQDRDAGTLRFWTVTDSLGAYALAGLPEGEYTIRSRAHGEYASARVTARTGVDYADLVVTQSLETVAEGRVIDTSGEPLAGVTVLPVLPGQPSVLSDRDGRFRLALAVKPGVRSFALRFQLAGYHEQTDKFDVPVDGSSDGVAMKIVMQPVEAWTSVRGTVKGDAGKPLAGLAVELRPSAARRTYRTTTDAKGRYAFPVVESPADYRLIVLGGAGYRDYESPLQVTPDMGEVDVVTAAYEFGTVTGQLVNMSGEPVPDFELVLRNTGSRNPNALVSTDEDGNFEVPEAPAGALVVASRSMPSILVEGLELPPGGKLHLPLVLDWGEHEIRGVVVDARGRPVPASRIVMQWSHQSDGITTRTTRRTAADTQGHFAFSRLGPGPHSLQVDAPGYGAVTVDHDVSREGYDLTVRMN